MKKIFYYSIICIAINFSCNTEKKEVLNEQQKQAALQEFMKSHPEAKIEKIGTNTDPELLKNAKVLNSADELIQSENKFQKFLDETNKNNKEVEAFSKELEGIKSNLTYAKFYQLVEKYPIVKNDMIRQIGSVEKFEKERKANLEKDKSK